MKSLIYTYKKQKISQSYLLRNDKILTRPIERPRSIVGFFERPRSIVGFFKRPRSPNNIKKVSVDAYLEL